MSARSTQGGRVGARANVWLVQVSTQSNYNDLRTTHIEIDWTVDWESRTFTGYVIHTVRSRVTSPEACPHLTSNCQMAALHGAIVRPRPSPRRTACSSPPASVVPSSLR